MRRFWRAAISGFAVCFPPIITLEAGPSWGENRAGGSRAIIRAEQKGYGEALVATGLIKD
jgi:hypothetical protein